MRRTSAPRRIMRRGSGLGSEPPPEPRPEVAGLIPDWGVNQLSAGGSNGHPSLTGRSVSAMSCVWWEPGRGICGPHLPRARGRRRGRAWLPPSRRSRLLPAALALAAAAAAAHLFPEQDANQLGESHDSGRRAQAEARPVPDESEGSRAGAGAHDDRGPEPSALDRQCLYEFTIASIASATSPARNGIPRTRLKPVASTRNSARTSFCSWPRLISGTSTLS